MTTTIADLPTWTGPAWATEHVETNGGIRWTRRPTTVVTDCPQPITPEGEPVSVAAVLVERQPVQVIIDGREFDLDGARALIAALTELVEAVEGTR